MKGFENLLKKLEYFSYDNKKSDKFYYHKFLVVDNKIIISNNKVMIVLDNIPKYKNGWYTIKDKKFEETNKCESIAKSFIKISNQINDYYPREVTIGFDDVKFPKLKITKNSVFEIKDNKINFYWNDEENSTIAEYDIIELSLLDSGINDVDFPLEQIKKLFEFSDVIKFEQKEDVKQAHKLTLQLDKNKYEVDSIQVLLMPYNIDISEEYKRDVKSYLGEN